MNPSLEVTVLLFLSLVFTSSPAHASPTVILDRAIVPADAPELTSDTAPKFTKIRFATSTSWVWMAASHLCVRPWVEENGIDEPVVLNYSVAIDTEGLAAFSLLDDAVPADVQDCIGEAVLAIPFPEVPIDGVYRRTDTETFKFDQPFGAASEDKTVVSTKAGPPAVPGPAAKPRTIDYYVRNATATLAALPK